MSRLTETDQLKTMISDFAKQNNYKVDAENLNRVVKGLIANKKKFGGYYCPCRRVKPEDEQYLAEITCPCKFVHDDIIANGQCHCLLFFAS